MTLYTTFEGRIGRARFVLGLLGLVLIGLLAGLVASFAGIAGFGGTWTNLVLSLLFLYPALALIVKRLHDRGRPALPFAAIYVAPGLLLNLMQALEIGFTPVRFGDLVTMQPSSLGLAATGLAFLTALVAFVDLCLMRGERVDNAFGPAPG
jgi:uncharacterized membrane protein YhaH (DUF805 family)